MTPKQESLYWREWGFVTAYCRVNRQPFPDRHMLHEKALGRDKSHKEFSNEDFDQVLGVFRAISRPASVDSQLRQMDQPKIRLLHKIDHELIPCLKLYISHPVEYVLNICLDKFWVQDWRSLSEVRHHPDRPSQLEQLIMTLSRALNGKRGFRAKAGHSIHEMRTAAGLSCTCKLCYKVDVLKEFGAAALAIAKQPSTDPDWTV